MKIGNASRVNRMGLSLRKRWFGFGTGVSSGGFTGVLDDYESGLVAAFSSRRLLSSHTGGAWTVLESGGSTEETIGFNADGTLDTTAMAAHVGANNGTLSAWINQATLGNVVQATATNQPTVVASGTNYENDAGNVSPYFVTNDQLLLSTGVSLSAFTLFVTCKLNAAAAFGMTVSLRPDGTLEFREEGTANRMQFQFTANSLEGGVTPTANAWRVWTIQADSASGDAELFADSVSRETQTGGTVATATQISMGARATAGDYPWNGFISEVLIYNSVLASSQRAAIETILSAYAT